jgi:hypothetical protein
MFERRWSWREVGLGLWCIKNIFKNIIDFRANKLAEYGSLLHFIGYFLNSNSYVPSLKIQNITIITKLNE